MLEAKLKIHVKVDFKFEWRSISNEKYVLQNPGKFKRNPQNYCYLIIIIWIMLSLTSVTPTDYHMAKHNAISMVWGAFRAKIIVKDIGVSIGGSRKGKKCFQHLSQGRKSKKCFQHLSPLPLSFSDMWEKVKREDLKTRIKDRGTNIHVKVGELHFWLFTEHSSKYGIRSYTPHMYMECMYIYTHIHTLTNYHRTIRYWEYYTKCYSELMSHKQEILKIVWLLFIC